MRSKKEIDAFTQHVMGQIEPEVFKTLNLLQLEAIKEAISANAPYKRHPVDIRLSVPLFFMTYYLVFLIGKDRRSSTRSKELKRGKMFSSFMVLGSLYIFLSMLIPLMFLLFYIIKSLLGIDIFPEQHLTDWL